MHGDCVMLSLFERIDAAIRAVTESVTVAELARREKAPDVR
jgi:DNA-binding IscR family transcriptional regulator